MKTTLNHVVIFVLSADIPTMDNYKTPLVFAGTFAAAYILLKFATNKRIPPHLRKVPALPWIPVIGSLPFIGGLEKWHEYFLEQSKRLGKVVVFYIGTR